jgi:hypothetical protein
VQRFKPKFERFEMQFRQLLGGLLLDLDAHIEPPAQVKPRLRFFWEYGMDTPFWTGNDEAVALFDIAHVELESLGVPEGLRGEITSLAELYDEAIGYWVVERVWLWRQDECDRFNDASRDVFRRCQELLGDQFELSYEVNECTEDLSLDRYLSEPEWFRREG